MPARRTQTARGYRNSRGNYATVIRFWFIPSIAFAGICRICALSPPGFVTVALPFIFLKEQLTFSAGTNNPMQELQLHMMSAFSQFERALLKERQADGIAAKKARGEKTGRPGADIKKIREIDALRSRGVRLRIACDHAGLGVSTYYKLRHQMNNQ